MDRLKQIETFVAVATKGSLTAAANAEGVAPAIIGRRLDALEERLGVKLLVRTTRKITLTTEGSAYLENCQRVLAELAEAEASVAAGGVKAAGHLRVTAPAGFGRKHVAGLVPQFVRQHPDVTVSIDLSDRIVDLVNEGFDCAVRVGDLPDSSLVSLRLADNRRVCVAAPEYIKRFGLPKTPHDLAHHNCLAFSSVASQPRGWVFRTTPTSGNGAGAVAGAAASGELLHTRVSGNMDCTDGQVLLDWCRAGLGLAWRSWWEVGTAVQRGELVTVLDDYAAPPNGIYAVFAQRKHLPLRVRLWIDFLKAAYSNAQYWEG
jgi:DNA-binding transcriptional LysR family regulator